MSLSAAVSVSASGPCQDPLYQGLLHYGSVLYGHPDMVHSAIVNPPKVYPVIHGPCCEGSPNYGPSCSGLALFREKLVLDRAVRIARYLPLKVCIRKKYHQFAQ